jgi:hypothetical protein
MRGRITRLGLAGLFFKFADQQFQLLDVAIKLFRRAAEPGPSQHRQLHLQLFDVQCLGVDFGSIGGDLYLLARQLGLKTGGKQPQRVGVFRVSISVDIKVASWPMAMFVGYGGAISGSSDAQSFNAGVRFSW